MTCYLYSRAQLQCLVLRCRRSEVITLEALLLKCDKVGICLRSMSL